ncbi:MAG: DUF4382 domain-containing protein [Halofilum sp. (in: g-proteobacteria)]|nr:DUF4382 domain-containing protein [Halofilum sp. (in: g-proteobacteria)]
MIHDRIPRSLPGAALAGAVLALASCGGGSGSATGELTLGITDAVVDDAEHVNVVFTGISLKPANGEPVTFLCDQPAGEPDFDCNGEGYRMIDLLELSGAKRAMLLEDITLVAGRYDWIRLLVNARGPGSSSLPYPDFPETNIVLKDNPDGPGEPLLIPSGPQTGLKLVGGFTVPSGGEASFTIDFDLRKAVVKTEVGPLKEEKFLLRPAFRLVDDNNVGTLAGEVAPGFVLVPGDPATTVADCDSPAVYVYEHEDDFVAGDLGSDNEPETTAYLVEPATGASSSNYTYEVGFLEAGAYKVAVACGENDNTDVAGESIPMSATKDADVTAGETKRLNFF